MYSSAYFFFFLARVSLHLKLWALLLSTPGNGCFLSKGEFHWYLKQNHYINLFICLGWRPAWPCNSLFPPYGSQELNSAPRTFTATTCWVISLPALIHTLTAILEFYEFHKVLFIFFIFLFVVYFGQTLTKKKKKIPWALCDWLHLLTFERQARSTESSAPSPEPESLCPSAACRLTVSLLWCQVPRHTQATHFISRAELLWFLNLIPFPHQPRR